MYEHYIGYRYKASRYTRLFGAASLDSGVVAVLRVAQPLGLAGGRKTQSVACIAWILGAASDLRSWRSIKSHRLRDT